jgi:hypothetical protein
LVIEMNPTADPRQSQTERKRGRKNAKKKNEIGAKEEEIRRFHGRNGSKKSPADSSPLRGSE